MAAAHRHRNQNQFWVSADLVVEVIRPDDPNRDKVKKRREYAAAGIQEYWLVDPEERTITILSLAQVEYREFGVFR